MLKHLTSITILCSVLLCHKVYAQPFLTEQVKFESKGTLLAGTVVFPKVKNWHAAVVFVHGSGPQQRNLYWAKKFAKDGIVALVYDKRGVAGSAGKYESKQSVSGFNIELLADDAAAALNLLANHPKTQNLTTGFAGISQAGWIVPLAANKTKHADFLVLWSGPVCKVSEEDIFSKYTADRDNAKPPSFEQALRARRSKYIWPDFLGRDTDPTQDLTKLTMPGFWIFGEQDGSIPVDLSIANLEKLKSAGFPYQYLSFESLGHNNMEQTFPLASSWIRKQSQ